MRLYLMQHGEAVDKNIDPDRPLSEQGQADVQRVADFLSDTNINIEQVFHSGKTRAHQTADILAKTLSDNEAQPVAKISPNDILDPINEFIPTLKQDTALVGHLPFMQRLASWLLTGSEDTAFQFMPGTIVCLEKTDSGWALQWMLRPDQIK